MYVNCLFTRVYLHVYNTYLIFTRDLCLLTRVNSSFTRVNSSFTRVNCSFTRAYCSFICVNCVFHCFQLDAFPLNMARVMYGDTQCKNDYVVIAGGSQTGDTQDVLFARDRFCGLALGYCGTMTAGATSCAMISGAVTSK